MTLAPPSQRKTIAIKGYQGWVGRASVALDALSQLEGQLEGFRVELFSTNKALVRKAKTAAKALGIELSIHPKNSLTNRQVIEILARSRVYMGLSLSDGASTSFLEAMAVGAFPIQTSSSCAEEWVTDGEAAFLIADLDARQIAGRLRKALSDDALVDAAAIKNQMEISVRASKAASQRLLKNFYY
jgi:glycosyltransferase involved in cell wall biosynthesis